MALELSGIVLISLALLDIWATRAVLRDDLSSRAQLVAQIAFIWLFPFLGALLALHLKRLRPEAYSGRYREEHDLGDDFGEFRRHRCSRSQPADTDGPAASEGADD